MNEVRYYCIRLVGVSMLLVFLTIAFMSLLPLAALFGYLICWLFTFEKIRQLEYFKIQIQKSKRRDQ